MERDIKHAISVESVQEPLSFWSSEGIIQAFPHGQEPSANCQYLIIAPAINGDSRAISFECRDEPGKFLTGQYNQVVSAKDLNDADDDAKFREAASFLVQPKKFWDPAESFESAACPGCYIVEERGVLKCKQVDSTDEQARMCASFLLMPTQGDWFDAKEFYKYYTAEDTNEEEYDDNSSYQEENDDYHSDTDGHRNDDTQCEGERGNEQKEGEYDVQDHGNRELDEGYNDDNGQNVEDIDIVQPALLQQGGHETEESLDGDEVQTFLVEAYGYAGDSWTYEGKLKEHSLDLFELVLDGLAGVGTVSLESHLHAGYFMIQNGNRIQLMKDDQSPEFLQHASFHFLIDHFHKGYFSLESVVSQGYYVTLANDADFSLILDKMDENMDDEDIEDFKRSSSFRFVEVRAKPETRGFEEEFEDSEEREEEQYDEDEDTRPASGVKVWIRGTDTATNLFVTEHGNLGEQAEMFKLVPALNNNPKCQSFLSEQHPGRYLVMKQSKLKLEENTFKPEFGERASFFVHHERWYNDMICIECSFTEGKFLLREDTDLMFQECGDSPSERFKQQASFMIEVVPDQDDSDDEDDIVDDGGGVDNDDHQSDEGLDMMPGLPGWERGPFDPPSSSYPGSKSFPAILLESRAADSYGLRGELVWLHITPYYIALREQQSCKHLLYWPLNHIKRLYSSVDVLSFQIGKVNTIAPGVYNILTFNAQEAESLLYKFLEDYIPVQHQRAQLGGTA